MTTAEAAARLAAMDQVLILTHVRPDGDTIGSAAALCCGLRALGKTAYLLPNPELTATYAPYAAPYLAEADFAPAYVVSVDIAALSLLPENARPYQDRIALAIDHHPSQEFFARETCLEADSAACGEIVYDILRQLTPLTPEMALPLYVAISTDTGCFVYSNTTPRSHRIAAQLMDCGPRQQGTVPHQERRASGHGGPDGGRYGALRRRAGGGDADPPVPAAGDARHRRRY